MIIPSHVILGTGTIVGICIGAIVVAVGCTAVFIWMSVCLIKYHRKHTDSRNIRKNYRQHYNNIIAFTYILK